MIVIRYAVILLDDNDSHVAVIGTGHEPLRKAHKSKATPAIQTLIRSALALHPTASSVEVVAWQPGVDLDQAPLLLTARKVEELSHGLAFSFPDAAVEAVL